MMDRSLQRLTAKWNLLSFECTLTFNCQPISYKKNYNFTECEPLRSIANQFPTRKITTLRNVKPCSLVKKKKFSLISEYTSAATLWNERPLSWRWRQRISANLWLPRTEVHGVTCQKVIFRVTDARTPKLTALITTRYNPRMAFHRTAWLCGSAVCYTVCLHYYLVIQLPMQSVVRVRN